MEATLNRGYGRSIAKGTLYVALATLAACASGPDKKKASMDELASQADPRYRPGQHDLGGDDADDGIVVEHEAGVLEQADVDRAIDRHVRSLIACYDRAGEAQQYASGEVMLKFVVAPGGSVAEVIVMNSGLGNYAVERCLVVEAKRIPFPSPRGGKNAEFEYSLGFRSTGEKAVVEWDADAVTRDVSSQSAQLGACGALASDLRAVAYVQPGGSVASVGLASQASIDPLVGICVVETIRKWKLPDDRSHMVRMAFPVEMSTPRMARPVARPEPKRIASKRVKSRRSTR